MIGGKTIILLGIAMTLAVVAVLVRVWVGRQPATSTEPNPPTKSRSFGWWFIIIVVLVETCFIAWLLVGNRKKNGATDNVMIRPTDEWSFTQICKSGKERHFEVEVKKREPGLLHIVVQQKCGGQKKNVGGLKLDTSGEGWTGTWVSYTDEDYGNVTLYRVADNAWSGKYVLQDGTYRLCTLKNETAMKVR